MNKYPAREKEKWYYKYCECGHDEMDHEIPMLGSHGKCRECLCPKCKVIIGLTFEQLHHLEDKTKTIDFNQEPLRSIILLKSKITLTEKIQGGVNIFTDGEWKEIKYTVGDMHGFKTWRSYKRK